MVDPVLWKVIMFISTIAWLFPPIRQYKGRFFGFFLILGLTDPIALTFGKLLGVFITQFYTVSFMLLPLTLISWSKISNKLIAFLAALIIAGILTILNMWEYSLLYHSTISAILLVIFVRITLVHVAETGKLNIFHLFLILYTSSMLLRILMILINFSSGITYHSITSIFQILLAVFFALYRDDNPKLLISLRKE